MIDEQESRYVVSEMYEPELSSIPHWSEEDRPREKLLTHGAGTLSKAELIAVLIGKGSEGESAVQLAQRILSACDNNLHTLSRLTATDFKAYNGMGDAKASAIIAACELARRREQEEQPLHPTLDTASLVYEFMSPYMNDLKHEQGWVLMMNNRFTLIGRPLKLSEGGITETAIDIRVIMKEALASDATVITLCHNHPSGNMTPSRDDDRLTQQLKAACQTMRIHMADHVIVTNQGYYSYLENGKL